MIRFFVFIFAISFCFTFADETALSNYDQYAIRVVYRPATGLLLKSGANHYVFPNFFLDKDLGKVLSVDASNTALVKKTHTEFLAFNLIFWPTYIGFFPTFLVGANDLIKNGASPTIGGSICLISSGVLLISAFLSFILQDNARKDALEAVEYYNRKVLRDGGPIKLSTVQPFNIHFDGAGIVLAF